MYVRIWYSICFAVPIYWFSWVLLFNNFLLICICWCMYELKNVLQIWSVCILLMNGETGKKLTTWNLHHLHEAFFKSFVISRHTFLFCFRLWSVWWRENTTWIRCFSWCEWFSFWQTRYHIIQISVDFNCFFVCFVFYLKICFILLNFVANSHLYTRHQSMQNCKYFRALLHLKS